MALGTLLDGLLFNIIGVAIILAAYDAQSESNFVIWGIGCSSNS